MKGTVSKVLTYALLVLKLESVTSPGQLNAFGLLLVFGLIVLAGLGDAVQVVIRIWNDGYTTGLPSLLSLLLVFGGMFLVCVAVIALTFSPPGRKGR